MPAYSKNVLDERERAGCQHFALVQHALAFWSPRLRFIFSFPSPLSFCRIPRVVNLRGPRVRWYRLDTTDADGGSPVRRQGEQGQSASLRLRGPRKIEKEGMRKAVRAFTRLLS